MHTREEKLAAFGRMLDVLDVLRVECPWDRKQTNDTLRPNTIEETYELCDALIKGDEHDICKELGDVLLHVCFYARMGEERAAFDVADVCNQLTDKLLYRHPHVYHPSQVGAPHPIPLSAMKETPAENDAQTATGASDDEAVTKVLHNWEQLKLKEKDGNKRTLAGVPTALPATIKAYRIQEKASNMGFDWEQRDEVWKKVAEELEELKTELKAGNEQRMEEELGDFLFSIVNAARLYHLHPDNALEQTNKKFTRRFNYIEEKAIEQGKNLKDMTLGEMDALWEEAKGIEH